MAMDGRLVMVCNILCNGNNTGSFDLTVTGGVPPYSFLWSNGATTEDISNLYAGNYSVTVTDANTCTISLSETVNQPGASGPGWTYSITTNSHSIVIPSTCTITINGVQVSNGSYLGVFYDNQGNLECGGYIIWQGATIALAAWPDDNQTSVKDGFSAGEVFTWKIWDVSTSTEYTASPTYMAPPIVPNQGNFVSNGQSGI